MDTNSPTTCSTCDHVFNDQMDGVLVVTFSGWGDRGFIDTFGSEEPALAFCASCAANLRRTLPLLSVIDPHLNINYSHVCEARSGEFVEEPLPSCSVDPDQHGWRKVWVTRPECTCGPNRNRAYAISDSESDADDVARSFALRGHSVRVSPMPLGNVSHLNVAPPV